MAKVQRLEHEGKLLAIVIPKDFREEGLTFVTDPEYGLQVGLHVQEKGWDVAAHIHIPFKELKNLEVQEMFYMEKGKLQIGLYDDAGRQVKQVEIGAGDVIILLSGHSIICSEDATFIEVKQGPYRGESEKRFYE